MTGGKSLRSHFFSPRAARALLVPVLGLACMAQAAVAAEFTPTRPVTLIVPFAAGGPNDAVARLVGHQLSKVWKQPVIVENKPGAGGLIGVTQASKAEPDGHTMVLATNVLTFPILNKDAAIKPKEDVVPITAVAGGPLVLAAPVNGKVKSMADVTAVAAKDPGALSSGMIAMTLSHLDSAYFFQRVAKATVTLVPFNSSSQGMQQLAGGQIDMYFTIVQAAKPLVDSGKLIVLGVTDDKRDPRLPNAPTMKEQGLPFNAGFWIGLYGPKGMPGPLAARIAADVRQALSRPEALEQIDKAGMSPMLAPPGEMRRMMEAEEGRYREAAKLVQTN